MKRTVRTEEGRRRPEIWEVKGPGGKGGTKIGHDVSGVGSKDGGGSDQVCPGRVCQVRFSAGGGGWEGHRLSFRRTGLDGSRGADDILYNTCAV